MLFLAQQGFDAIAHDRRGPGPIRQAPSGNDMNTYSADLASIVEVLGADDELDIGFDRFRRLRAWRRCGG